MTAGLAGGLLAAWALTARRFATPLAPGEGEFAFDAWLKIGKDGVVSVAVPGVEMGQGLSTLIPQIVAMELGADWRQVAAEPAPLSGAYGNAPLAAHWAPLWLPVGSALASAPDSLLAQRFAESEPFMVTAAGTALAAHEAAARAAAAGARAMLAMAAADRWGVAWEECEAQGGFIIHGKRRASFAQLAEEAAGYTPPDPPVLGPQAPAERPGEFPPGAPLRFPRLDLPAKVDGSFTFAGDVRLADMLHAAIRHAPVGTARLGSHDAAAASKVEGLVKLVEGPDWLAAVGTSWWTAERALALIAPRFTVSDRAHSATIAERLERGLERGAATRIAQLGDPDAYLSERFEHTAHYAIAPALHAGLETASATARVSAGKAEIWAASQAPHALRRDVAAALGFAAQDVVLYPLPAGGSFDARLDSRHAVEAALIAQDVGRPVQLTWSRWQEAVAGLPKAPARAVLAARTAPDGSLTALKIRVAMPGTVNEFGRRLFAGESRSEALAAQGEGDPLALEGAVPPYGIAHLVVEHVPVKTALPSGPLHGNSWALGAFLTETFVDELAQRSGREALSYRMAMLGHDLKLAQVLQRAASLAEWDGGAKGSGQGLACWRAALGGREGRIALVATARRDDAGIRVDKLTVVVDCGRVINTDIARQQVEGGLLFGLGLARGATTNWADGLPLNGRIGLMGLPLLGDCPVIEIEFVDSQAEPFDPAELAVAIAPPAIANALFSAGSERLRTLPLAGGQG